MTLRLMHRGASIPPPGDRSPMNRTIIAVVAFLLLLLLSYPARADVWDRFFPRLWKKEAGGKLHPKDGDNGKAIGPLQIWYVYWKDSGIKYGKYQDCRNLAHAKQVVKLYMMKYARKAVEKGDLKTMARIHNGGPKGHLKKATLKYAKSF